jgi:DNA glycosylase AlkZ-like
VPRATDAEIESSIARGDIIRIHILRPTWHFVAPEDVHWLLALTARRIRAGMAPYLRRLEIDHASLVQALSAIVDALRDGQQLTRPELGQVLQTSGINPSGGRTVYFLMCAELEGLICGGARRGNQTTFGLLDPRVPRPRVLSRQEALAELAIRYFSSHGPATEDDFKWWSGMTKADVRTAHGLASRSLVQETVRGKTYWRAQDQPAPKRTLPSVLLLPNYDELIVGYADRREIFDPAHLPMLDSRRNPLFQNTILMKGQISGTWKRTLKRQGLHIETIPFVPFGRNEARGLDKAIRRYAEYLGLRTVSGARV